MSWFVRNGNLLVGSSLCAFLIHIVSRVVGPLLCFESTEVTKKCLTYDLQFRGLLIEYDLYRMFNLHLNHRKSQYNYLVCHILTLLRVHFSPTVIDSRKYRTKKIDPNRIVTSSQTPSFLQQRFWTKQSKAKTSFPDRVPPSLLFFPGCSCYCRRGMVSRSKRCSTVINYHRHHYRHRRSRWLAACRPCAK